ncbi:MAG: uracil-DNA glycosylase [Bacilli bacterium]|nr:uracil-DNA glycosylase [Bacilli bacterium]
MSSSWKDFFEKEKEKAYFRRLEEFLDNEYKNKVIYPPRDLVFNAFSLCPLDKIKVVIIGQDPYHEPGQAMGLSFSVPSTCKVPPSLKNIYKEIEDDCNEIFFNKDGDLTYLANQGVLLLNSILTVEQGKPLSHNIKEYEELYHNILKELDELDYPLVFMLWGGNAKKQSVYLKNPKHLVLCANHPSPLSANRGGFFGCKHFSKANQFLIQNGIEPIIWTK